MFGIRWKQKSSFPTNADFSLTENEAILAASKLCLIFIVYYFFASLKTKTYSHVDRLWSLTPIFYSFVFTYYGKFNSRNVLMSALIFIWGVRLTRNFARKGGYNRGEEDYRWAVLREKKILNSKFGWLLFNFSFICFYQHALLFLITAPCAWAATPYAQKIPLNEYDLYATLLFLFFFNLERVADNQQWRFQQAKYGKAKREAKYETDYQNGFLSKGLFARSRHPNFFSEQMIWWSLCVFVLASGGSALPQSCSEAKGNWYWLRLPKTLRCCGSCFFVSIPGLKCGCEALHACYVGAVLLSLLFQGSTAFTEQITAGKYPTYKEYQKKVNRLFPALRPPSFFLSAENSATRIQHAWKKKKKSNAATTSTPGKFKKAFLSFGRKSSSNNTPAKKSE